MGGRAVQLTGRAAAFSVCEFSLALALALPSIGMMSAWCLRRSIRATAHDAFGKTVSHCLKSTFVVTTIERCS